MAPQHQRLWGHTAREKLQATLKKINIFTLQSTEHMTHSTCGLNVQFIDYAPVLNPAYHTEW